MMDCCFPLLSQVHYDVVQLNRIEMMLTQLMAKLSGNDESLKVFGVFGSNVADPCVSGLF